MGKQWQTLFLGGSKITSDGDCSHKLKIRLLLGRKAMTHIDSILKSRDIPLLTKVHLVKVMIFPLVMYVCEHWAIKKAECQRIDAFELWCWRRLKIPLDCKEIQPVHPKGNQSWILSTDAEANSSTLATWFEELTHLKRSWCWELLKAGGEVVNRGWDGWMASPTQWTWIWVNFASCWWTGRPGMLLPWAHKESDMSQQLKWTEKRLRKNIPLSKMNCFVM